MFTLMIKYSYVPKSMSISTMVSIPKNKLGNLSDSKNYRGIALSSIFGKLFDLCIIELQCNVLHTDKCYYYIRSLCLLYNVLE